MSNEQVREALKRARDSAMWHAGATLIPVCAEFAAIAQDLDFVIAALAQPEQRGEVADRFCPHCGYDHSAGPLCSTLIALQCGPCGKSPCPAGMVCKSPFCRRAAPPAPVVPDGCKPEPTPNMVNALLSHLIVTNSGSILNAKKALTAALAAAPEVPR